MNRYAYICGYCGTGEHSSCRVEINNGSNVGGTTVCRCQCRRQK